MGDNSVDIPASAIAEFRAITQATEADARAALASAGGDVAGAVNAFYAGGGGGGAAAAAAPAPAAAAAPAARRPPPASNNAGPTIRSLADLRAEEEPSDDDDANEYYAGGEKSGQVVKGAPKDPVGDVFDAARRGGGGGGARPPAPTAGGAFTGAARTLAGGSGGGSGGGGGGGPTPGPYTPAPVAIEFYTNGVFTVGGGPPRDAADPAERDFLGALAAGECPAELEEAAAAAAAAAGHTGPLPPVPVSLVRHGGPYEAPPEPAVKAFTGTGRTLGGGGGGGGGAAAEPAPEAPPPPPAAAPTSGGWPGPDESAPTTSIQIRLADGFRLVARFNLSQTVGDIRAFIAAAAPPPAPGGPPRPARYTLARAGVPPLALTDEGATIEAAGLAGSVVVQKAA